jgi:hypothetical protein
MECRTVRGSLSEYLDGQISWRTDSEAREFEAHLASCSGCHNLQLELTEIRTAARELPLRTPPRALWTRIVNEIEAEQATTTQVSSGWWSRLVAFRFTLSLPQMAGAAALAIILISVGISNFSGLSGLRGTSTEMDFTRLQSALIREEMSKRAEIDRKMAAIEERKASWDPARRADFERQLNRIEESIRQCRQSLEATPNDLNQVQRMLDLYEEKRQLLEDVERLKW